MKSSRVVVTGAGGFVAANLTRRLVEQGHAVTAIVRPGGDAWRLAGVALETVELDLRDAAGCSDLIASVQPEVVFHLAAHGAYSWQTAGEAIVATNLLGTMNLLDACAAHGFDAFVHAGSSSEYGLKDHPASEDERLEPNSVYAVSKAAATHYCAFRARAEGLPVVTLRLYSVYGPLEDPRRLVPRLVAHGLSGALPPLVSPDVARDFVYVADAVDAFVRAADAAERGRAETFNVGSGRQTTLGELVALTRELLGIGAEPEWGSMARRSWDTETWVADVRKAASGLGWRPRHSLADGLRATAEWLRDAPELWTRYGVTAR